MTNADSRRQKGLVSVRQRRGAAQRRLRDKEKAREYLRQDAARQQGFREVQEMLCQELQAASKKLSRPPPLEEKRITGRSAGAVIVGGTGIPRSDITYATKKKRRP